MTGTLFEAKAVVSPQVSEAHLNATKSLTSRMSMTFSRLASGLGGGGNTSTAKPQDMSEHEVCCQTCQPTLKSRQLTMRCCPAGTSISHLEAGLASQHILWCFL